MTTKIETAHDMQDLLIALIGSADCGSEPDIGDLDTWSTYEEASMLTTDAGLVVRTSGGRTFQITIVEG